LNTVKKDKMKPAKILVIASSKDQMGDSGFETGVWLEELAATYYVFMNAGAEVTLASPTGGAVPLDPKSQSIILATFNSKQFLKDERARHFLNNALLLEDMRAENFDAVFIPGGYGLFWDLAANDTVKRLLENFNKKDKPIGAVSQGVACLLALQNNGNELLIKGKRITCFSNSEEENSGRSAILPFSLETSVSTMGAIFNKDENYVSHIEMDGNIVTGQNPASAKAVANQIMALVRNNHIAFDKLLQPVLN
jgi:putative intracellular protease/amidase